MNRRNFIKGLITAAAGFSILPGAGRIWKAEARIVRAIINPAYRDAPYEIRYLVHPGANIEPFQTLSQDQATPLLEAKRVVLKTWGIGRYGFNPWPVRMNEPVDLNDREAIQRAAIPPFIFVED